MQIAEYNASCINNYLMSFLNTDFLLNNILREKSIAFNVTIEPNKTLFSLFVGMQNSIGLLRTTFILC